MVDGVKGQKGWGWEWVEDRTGEVHRVGRGRDSGRRQLGVESKGRARDAMLIQDIEITIHKYAQCQILAHGQL